ncbi:MAG: hypothetical protein RBR22_01375 [Desulfuromonas sp.]|nr:hypothetical protein [Desulfuromonas sp.]
MQTNVSANRQLGFVACVSDVSCLNKYLLASPCLQRKEYSQAIYFNASSAAAAFNAEMDKNPQFEWLIWVHQDVFLPSDWDKVFIQRISEATDRFPRLAVVGVYGVSNFKSQPKRLGNVCDRGQKLCEPATLPSLANSFDEMLIAARCDSGLRFDPNLGFDFYATDIALTAFDRGLEAAVVDASCQHWSSTSREMNSIKLAQRIIGSANVFEQKWNRKLPLTTSCFSINKIGDVALQCSTLITAK